MSPGVTVDAMEVLQTIDTGRIRALRDRKEFFWLDLAGPTAADLDALSDLVTFHPLALEDTREFGQRVKLDDYAHNSLLVAYGAEPREAERPHLVEVHLHISDEALVTVSREPLGALAEARHRVAASSSAHDGHPVYGVLDALADSFLTALDAFDDAIDGLQDALAEHATSEHRQQIFRLRRQLAEMRQVVIPQRDLLAPDGKLVDTIPHLHGDRAYNLLRDVHDHLDRATGLIDAYREQLASLLDLYLTEVSTRLNEVMKRLTFIATVFLPLTFLSGFFGMNFGWFVQRITPLWTFFVFGIGLAIASTAAVAVYLRRTGAR